MEERKDVLMLQSATSEQRLFHLCNLHPGFVVHILTGRERGVWRWSWAFAGAGAQPDRQRTGQRVEKRNETSSETSLPSAYGSQVANCMCAPYGLGIFFHMIKTKQSQPERQEVLKAVRGYCYYGNHFFSIHVFSTRPG